MTTWWVVAGVALGLWIVSRPSPSCATARSVLRELLLETWPGDPTLLERGLSVVAVNPRSRRDLCFQ